MAEVDRRGIPSLVGSKPLGEILDFPISQGAISDRLELDDGNTVWSVKSTRFVRPSASA